MSLTPGKRVRHWRELLGITQQQLAADAEVEVTRLCRIELDKTPAKADEIERLAAAMDLTMGQFYGAADEAKAS